MNKRKLKNFFKKGGHYHYDKTIKRITHKKLLHPLVTDAGIAHAVVWIPIGQCPTCDHCTDMCIDWDGTPYMCFSNYGICGKHHGDYGCKRYKLDPDLKFFKVEEVHPDSPDSELKRYIDKQIEDKHESYNQTEKSNNINIDSISDFCPEDFKKSADALSKDLYKRMLDAFNVPREIFDDKIIDTYLNALESVVNDKSNNNMEGDKNE